MPLDSHSRAHELAILRQQLAHGGLVPNAALPSSALSAFLGELAQSLFQSLVMAMHSPELVERIVTGSAQTSS